MACRASAVMPNSGPPGDEGEQRAGHGFRAPASVGATERPRPALAHVVSLAQACELMVLLPGPYVMVWLGALEPERLSDSEPHVALFMDASPGLTRACGPSPFATPRLEA